MVGGPTCEWVSKDGLTVGGLVVAMGGCEGCGGSVGGGGCVFILFYFFFGGCGCNNFSGCGFSFSFL